MAVTDHSSERFQRMINELSKDEQLNVKELPGLADHLTNIVDPKVDVSREESVRGFLKVFWQSETDGTYSEVLKKYTPDEEKRLRAFVQDDKPAAEVGKDFKMGLSIGAREELPIVDKNGNGIPDDQELGTLAQFGHNIHELAHNLKESFLQFMGLEDITIWDDKHCENKVATYVDMEFQNWGRTVKNKPRITCVPRTAYGIQQIIKYAKANQMNVRASGYRHSWSPVFGKNGEIIISTLGLYKATMLPNIESLPGSQYFEKDTELNSIKFAAKPEPGKKRLVRVGTAVTNQMLRRWCNEQKLDDSSTLPLNVIMVEITFGGSNAPICHGAGRSHPTLSDLVHKLEYIDVNGNKQYLSKDEDPQFMKAAAGCFGLLGIVTHLTLELDPMVYAFMVPKKLPVMQAVPPPPGLADKDIPEALFIKMTPQERAEAQKEFEARARNDFYSEWFWYPYTSKVWVNCWNVTKDATGAQEYPTRFEVFVQWAETVMVNIVQRSQAVLHLQKVCPGTQTTLISKMGLYAMPDLTPETAIKTKLPNALHFRRAIQNVRVRDMEFEMPLMPKQGALKDAKFEDEIDWSYVQRAWWDAILVAYRNYKTCPQRMPLEMRITGASDIIMAPYRGHNLGSCSIEILTLENMAMQWMPYCQEVLDHWLSYKDKDGNYLPTRPHFAKEWYYLKARGQPMLEYLKDQYKDSIVEFRDTLQQIAKKQGWSAKEAQLRFSNEMLDKLIFDTPQSKPKAVGAAPAQKVSSQMTARVHEVAADAA